MQVQVDIPFDQLVQIAKQLPVIEWTKLKAAVENEPIKDTEREAFKEILLHGPTFSEKQLASIAKTRKAINEWRTK